MTIQPIQTNTQTELNWLDEELNSLGTCVNGGERLPSLKLEAGKLISFTIDASVPFGVWTKDGVTKAMIPCMHKGERKLWWLNKRNPVYRQVMERLKKGQKDFKISTTGTQKDTQYAIVDED